MTIGQSARNTFAVPTAEMPRTFTLFHVVNNHYTLNFADTMDGRLVDDNTQPTTFGQLRTGGKAQRNGNVWQLAVTDNARGKIIIGEMTLLFQFVAAPPLQPRPQLPHSVRGTLLDRVDPYLAIILILSLAAHSSMYVYFKWFYDEKKEDPQAQYKKYLVELKDLKPVIQKKIEPPKVATATTAADKKPDEDKKDPDKSAEEKKPPKAAPTEAEIRRRSPRPRRSASSSSPARRARAATARSSTSRTARTRSAISTRA